jgi:hypothetical protein
MRTFSSEAGFVYAGTTPQVTGDGLPPTVEYLTIENQQGVTISVPTTVNGTLFLPGGDLELNGITITLGSGGQLTETPGNTVKGTSGVITTTRTLVAPGSATDIAGLGIRIASASNLGSTVITRGHSVQTIDTVTSISRYFDVSPANNAGLNATIVFGYDPSELGGSAEEDLALYRSTDTGLSWSQLGGVVDTADNAITLTGIESFSRWTAGVSSGLTVAVNIPIAAGWNMVSNPVSTPYDSVTQLFPTTSFSYAFAFGPGGYQTEYRMLNGRGYWSKFPAGTNQAVIGYARSVDTISVSTGWNLVGSISSPVNTAAIQWIPNGILSTPIYGFENGYQVTDTIVPGKGYWVKVSAPGVMVLTSGSSSGPVTKRVEGKKERREDARFPQVNSVPKKD